MKRLGVMGAAFLNSRVISPPISGSFGIILVGEVSHEAAKSTKEGEDGQGKRHPPPLKLWRTGKAGRTEVSREEGGLTRSHELHEGRGGWTRKKEEGGPPPLKLGRTGKAGRTEEAEGGHAEVMRSRLLSFLWPCAGWAPRRGAHRAATGGRFSSSRRPPPAARPANVNLGR